MENMKTEKYKKELAREGRGLSYITSGASLPPYTISNS
jgi:hypothetical protein